MENHYNSSSTTIGFCLLPSELIEKILFNLILPEILRLKSLNKTLAATISDQAFVREYNSQTMNTTWLYVYKKRWNRDFVLHCFTDRSDRWFKIQIAHLLEPIISPGESIYLLTASGNFSLFASNINKEVIAVNLVSKTVKKIPPSPLGPRCTSSWRRSGMKLVSGPDRFRFFFAELVNDRPILFVYRSDSDTWQSMEVREGFENFGQRDQCCDTLFLHVINRTYESTLVAVGPDCDRPAIVRLGFNRRRDDEQHLTIGFSYSNVIDRIHVYGDGHMVMVKSNGGGGVRMVNGIELWGIIGKNGREWGYMSKVPSQVMEEIKRPYMVMTGCLERRDGKVRIVLLSNFESLWDIVWLSYDVRKSYWDWVSVPDCRMNGLNIAGVAFSSGLTLS